MRASAGRAYYDRKISEGKTHNEAMRCLKRRLADRVWRTMIADERRAEAGPGGHSGATLSSSAAGSTPIWSVPASTVRRSGDTPGRLCSSGRTTT
jgi:hypothetical protein